MRGFRARIVCAGMVVAIGVTACGGSSNPKPQKTAAQIQACWTAQINQEARALIHQDAVAAEATGVPAAEQNNIDATKLPVEVTGLTVDAADYAKGTTDTTGAGVTGMGQWLKKTATMCGGKM